MRWLAAFAVFALGCAASGRSPGSAKSDPTAKGYKGPKLPQGSVTLHDAYGGAHRLSVELAGDDASRERGLMWRSQLAPGTGMLFVFPEDENHSFWMKNTLIPLDMLFLADDGRVVGIVENAEPQSLDPRGVGQLSRFVLEVPGGWTAKNGVRPGSPAEIEGISMLPVQ
jgi:uncharacterized membrane protein (UPF0127 family)